MPPLQNTTITSWTIHGFETLVMESLERDEVLFADTVADALSDEDAARARRSIRVSESTIAAP